MRELANYNIGVVMLRRDQANEARQLFEQTRQQSADEKLSALADQMLRRLGPSSPSTEESTRWVSFVDFNVGHDDNVALLDDASLPAGVSVDSNFTELVAVATGPISSDPGFRFDGSAYSVRYGDANEFDQNAIRIGGVYQWRTRTWRTEAGPHFNYSTLDGDGFEQRIGAGLRFRRSLGAAAVLGFRLVHDEVDGAESQFGFLEGSREQLGVSFDKFIASSPFRHSSYDDLAEPRNEDRTEVSLSLIRHLPHGWRVNSTYRWYDNDSNVDLFEYTRSRLTFGLTRSL